MTQRYRYTNTKFWLLTAACVTILCGSIVFQLVSIIAYDRQFQHDFRDTADILLNTTAIAVVERTKGELQSISDATVGKLDLLKFESAVVQKWLGAVLDRFQSSHPFVVTILLYDDHRSLIYTHGNTLASECLSDTLLEDSFCTDNGQLAYRISVPIYNSVRQSRGRLVAIVQIPDQMIARYERNFHVMIHIRRGAAFLYQSAQVEYPAITYHLDVDARSLTSQAITVLPSKFFWRRGIWYVYTVRLTGASGEFTVRMFRNGNFLTWKVFEMLCVNSFLLAMTIILFNYFHVNYRYISHTYRAVFDGMADMLAFKDTSGAYQMINTVMARTMFDKHPKEVVGQTDHELGLPVDMLEQCVTSDRAVLATQQTHRLIESGTTTSGQFVIFDVLKTPMFTETGKFGGVIICGRDISEQSRLQRELDTMEDSYFSSEWILAKLFQTMPEFLYLKDRQHRFVRASESICEFYGVPDIIGKSDFDLLPPNMARSFWEEEERLLTGQQENYTKQDQVITQDGRVRYFLTTKTIFRDKRGAIAGLLGIGRDVTEMMDKQTALEFAVTLMTEQMTASTLKRKQKTDAIATGGDATT